MMQDDCCNRVYCLKGLNAPAKDWDLKCSRDGHCLTVFERQTPSAAIPFQPDDEHIDCRGQGMRVSLMTPFIDAILQVAVHRSQMHCNGR